MKITASLACLAALISVHSIAYAQQKQTDANAPLHALQPDYATPYLIPEQAAVKKVLDRVFVYLDSVTPAQFVHKITGAEYLGKDPDTNIIFRKGDFRLTSYEWGVTYSGMLAAGTATGDKRYTDYVRKRLELIASAAPGFRKLYERSPSSANPLRQVLNPRALDDAGAMCAAMIKMMKGGGSLMLKTLTDNYANYISTKEFRLPDGFCIVPVRHHNLCADGVIHPKARSWQAVPSH